MMTLKEIGATLTTLLSRADGALKAEVESLKATVEGAVSDLNAQLSAALTENQSLKGSVETLTARTTSLGTELTAALSEIGSINAAITDACIAGKLLDLKGELTASDGGLISMRDAAMKLHIADKFKTYQGAVNAAMAKLNLAAENMPEASTKTPQPALTGIERAIEARKRELAKSK